MTILLLAALIPPIFLVIKIYQMDKIEKEPVGLIVRLLIFGALTCIPAAFIETFGERIISSFLTQGSMLYYLVEAFLVVAWAEEGVKHFVLKRLTWRHPAFDYHFDAVVYATAASLGFAALENVMYVMGVGSVSEGLSVAASRGLLSIPGHCIFGIFMGVYYGKAKHEELSGNIARAKSMMRLSMVVPVLLHGFYDFCLFTQNAFFIGVFLVFIVILDIVAFRSIRQYSREDTML